MPQRRRPTLTRLLTHAVVKTLAVTAGGACFVMGSPGTTPSAVGPEAPESSVVASEPVRTPESRLMKRYDCSTEGFGADAEPQSALVRDRRGHLSVVSFAEGWAVHTSGRTDHVLVAVCLHPDPAETAR